MVFETIGIYILRTREKIKLFLYDLLNMLRSQMGAIILSAILIVLSFLLIWVWTAQDLLWVKIIYSIVYFLCFLIYSTALYFLLTKKQIKKINSEYQVMNTHKFGHESFQFHQLSAITKSQEDIKNLYLIFSKAHLKGSHDSFVNLIFLTKTRTKNKVIWIDPISKNPNQINRQTLLEFLSQLFSGFENLDNQSIRKFVAAYFQDEKGNELLISSKNISDWRSNQSIYLKDISAFIQQAIKG